jgi:hypothetical protein
MAPRTIYTSPYPSFPIHSVSIFTRLLTPRASADDIGGFPGSLKAFIDATSGASITRAELAHLALSFAYGLRNHPNTRAFANRGDTLLIYSPNSLAWPVVLFGGASSPPYQSRSGA